VFPAVQQRVHHMAADIAGSASNKNAQCPPRYNASDA
jgi:hypothetical protein